ncbi:MAG: hypothetical protein KGV59_03955 [Tenacibaculum sp.]|nr:hypothetical protein [Tenacibaculum sp.]
MFKKLIIIFTIAFSSICYSQTDYKWRLGVGTSIIKFADKDVEYIGDKHLIQIPNFSITRKINDRFSADITFSLTALNKLIVTNEVDYFSIDFSGRYNYFQNIEKLEPYVFVGGSIVSPTKSKRKTTPTFNIGTGATYWFSDRIGANGQICYKYSLKSFESMRSHLQFSLGIVISLDFGGGRLNCEY